MRKILTIKNITVATNSLNFILNSFKNLDYSENFRDDILGVLQD